MSRSELPRVQLVVGALERLRALLASGGSLPARIELVDIGRNELEAPRERA